MGLFIITPDYRQELQIVRRYATLWTHTNQAVFKSFAKLHQNILLHQNQMEFIVNFFTVKCIFI